MGGSTGGWEGHLGSRIWKPAQSEAKTKEAPGTHQKGEVMIFGGHLALAQHRGGNEPARGKWRIPKGKGGGKQTALTEREK